MCGHTAEDESCQEGERHDEGVKESVVAFSHTVSHPRTVMVESLWGEGKERIFPLSSLYNEMLFNIKFSDAAESTAGLWNLHSLFNAGKCQCVCVSAAHPHSCHTGCSGRFAEAGTSCRWSSTWASPPAGWWRLPWCVGEVDSWCFQWCLQDRTAQWYEESKGHITDKRTWWWSDIQYQTNHFNGLIFFWTVLVLYILPSPFH